MLPTSYSGIYRYCQGSTEVQSSAKLLACIFITFLLKIAFCLLSSETTLSDFHYTMLYVVVLCRQAYLDSMFVINAAFCTVGSSFIRRTLSSQFSKFMSISIHASIICYQRWTCTVIGIFCLHVSLCIVSSVHSFVHLHGLHVEPLHCTTLQLSLHCSWLLASTSSSSCALLLYADPTAINEMFPSVFRLPRGVVYRRVAVQTYNILLKRLVL